MARCGRGYHYSKVLGKCVKHTLRKGPPTQRSTGKKHYTKRRKPKKGK